MDVRKDSVVLEVRPPLTRTIWPWIGEQLGGFELIDGSIVKREKDNDHFAKIVLHGNQNTVYSLWKKKTKTMVYQGNMISLKCVGYGAFNATQFGPSHFEQGAQEVEFEFDSHEDANAVINNKDMNRALDASESSIIDIIDEVGSHLPQLHREFETHSKTASLMPSDAKYISVHGAAKAMEGVLHIHVKVENLLLEDHKLIDLTMHSAAHLLGDDEDKYNIPFLTYVQFLTIYLKLKRLKEEDPNIVSPRLNSPRAAEPPPPGQGTALGGGGDTFGRGLASLVSPRTSPRTLGLSPRSEASVSPRVPSPRTLPSLTIFKATEDNSRKEFTSTRLAGTGENASPGGSPGRGEDTNSVSARMALSARAENIVNKRDADKLNENQKKVMLSERRKRYNPKHAMVIRRRCDVFDATYKFKRDFGDLTVLRPMEATQNIQSGVTFNSINSTSPSINKLKPIVPRLPLGGNPSRGSHSRMDRFIDKTYGNTSVNDKHDDNSIQNKTAITLIGSPGLDHRMIRKKAFPALRSDHVEPQHWFITLQFWESIDVQYRSCVSSGNQDESKAGNIVMNKKKKKTGKKLHKEKTMEDVYRSFKSFDPTALYATDDDDDNDDTVKIFVSDVPALMDSFGFKSKVHINNDLNLAADTVYTNIDTHTYKDNESGVRIGTGDTYWTCELLFWASLFNEYRTNVKLEVERCRKEEYRRRREEAFLCGTKLKKQESKREQSREEKISGLGIGEDVKDMESLARYYEENKDAPLVTEEVPESTLAKNSKNGDKVGPNPNPHEHNQQQPVRPTINLADLDICSFLRLQDTHYVHWSEFKAFFLHFLTAIVSTQLIALRRLIASEMWLNIKQKAVHLDLAKILADPTEYKKERFERQQAAKDRERERRLLMTGELFVGESNNEDKESKEEGRNGGGYREGKEAKTEIIKTDDETEGESLRSNAEGGPKESSKHFTLSNGTPVENVCPVKCSYSHFYGHCPHVREEEEEVQCLMETDQESGELKEEVADVPEDNHDKTSLLENVCPMKCGYNHFYGHCPHTKSAEKGMEKEIEVDKPLSARERFRLSQQQKRIQKEKEKGEDVEEKPLSARERFKLSQQHKGGVSPSKTPVSPSKSLSESVSSLEMSSSPGKSPAKDKGREKELESDKPLSARERFKMSQQQKQPSATDTTPDSTAPTLERIDTTNPATNTEKEKSKTVSSPMRQRFKAAQMAKKKQDPTKDVVISPRMDTTDSGLRDESKVNSSPVHPSKPIVMHSPRSGEKEKEKETPF
jgi:hypothetical protein